MVKTRLPVQETQKMQVRSLGGDDPMQVGTAIHFSVLGWRILWTEEPGRLQSMESQRAGHDQSNLACMQAKTWKPES